MSNKDSASFIKQKTVEDPSSIKQEAEEDILNIEDVIDFLFYHSLEMATNDALNLIDFQENIKQDNTESDYGLLEEAVEQHKGKRKITEQKRLLISPSK